MRRDSWLLETLHRYVPLAIWAIVFLVILAIPLKIISYGYLPSSDALRYAARAVNGKEWSEIVILNPAYKNIGDEFGWHLFLRQIFLWSHCSTTALVLLSVALLFVLVGWSALPWLKRPEAWLIALLVVGLTSDLTIRFSLGRPLLLTMTGLLTILFAWRAHGSGQAGWRVALWMAAVIAFCVFMHGVWYLWLLPVAAFLLAGQFRWGLVLAAGCGVGSLFGASFTGHPFAANYQAGETAWRTLAVQTTDNTLVTELQPSSGEVFGLIVLGGLLVLRHLAKLNVQRLGADPVFWLAGISWVLSFKVARFAEDWGWPALMVLLTCDLQQFLQSRVSSNSFKRLGLACGLAVTTFLALTNDIGGRWTQNLNQAHLESGNPALRGWLPESGGVFYTTDMKLFFQTLFKNPNADWRYLLGFEPTLLPGEDFKIYHRILLNPADPEAYQPWIQKMKPADRLVIRVTGGPAPPIPQLEWGYGVGGIWIGRLPRAETTQTELTGAEKAAIAAAQSWLALIDAGRYSESWRNAGPVLQAAISEHDSIGVLSNNRNPLGNFLSRKLKSVELTTSLPSAPDGQYAVMKFDASFEKRKSAVETVTFRLEKDEKWKAAGYSIE